MVLHISCMSSALGWHAMCSSLMQLQWPHTWLTTSSFPHMLLGCRGVGFAVRACSRVHRVITALAVPQRTHVWELPAGGISYIASRCNGCAICHANHHFIPYNDIHIQLTALLRIALLLNKLCDDTASPCSSKHFGAHMCTDMSTSQNIACIGKT